MMKELVRKFFIHKLFRFTCQIGVGIDDLTAFSIGGGSASDSGRSIASSVSTEPFFTGQNAPTEASQTAVPATDAQTPTQAPVPIGSESNASNEQSVLPTIAEPSTSQAPEVQPDDTNESQDTNELREQESKSTDDNADNNDVINVYSSGDEGKQLKEYHLYEGVT